MKGLIGAATVVGSLQLGGGVCESTGLNAGHPRESKNDAQFLREFSASAISKQGHFPPGLPGTDLHQPECIHGETTEATSDHCGLTAPQEICYEWWVRPNRGLAAILPRSHCWIRRNGDVAMPMGIALMGLIFQSTLCSRIDRMLVALYSLIVHQVITLTCGTPQVLKPSALRISMKLLGCSWIGSKNVIWGVQPLLPSAWTLKQDLSVVEEVANRLHPLTYGPRHGSRSHKKARTEESTTPTRVQDTSSDSASIRAARPFIFPIR